MWEQLFIADPPLKYPEDIELFAKYWDCHQFMHFMMGLREDFKPTKASLLTQSPIPPLDVTVKELIWEENRRSTCHISSSNYVLATPSPPSQLPLLHSLLFYKETLGVLPFSLPKVPVVNFAMPKAMISLSTANCRNSFKSRTKIIFLSNCSVSLKSIDFYKSIFYFLI